MSDTATSEIIAGSAIGLVSAAIIIILSWLFEWLRGEQS